MSERLPTNTFRPSWALLSRRRTWYLSSLEQTPQSPLSLSTLTNDSKTRVALSPASPPRKASKNRSTRQLTTPSSPLSSNTRDKARLLSLAISHAGAWLTVVPIKGLGLCMQPAEFQAAVRYRLGIPVFPAERRCPSCPGTLDIMGDHAITCPGHGDRIFRHDRIRDAIFSAATSAALSPRKEEKDLITGNRSKPADIYVPTWSAGLPAAFDVMITSPLQPTTITRAAETAGASLTVAEEGKYRKHCENCDNEGITFIPLVVETLGGWSALALRTVRRIAILADARRPTPRDSRVAPLYLLQALSVQLMRGNGHMMVSRYH